MDDKENLADGQDEREEDEADEIRAEHQAMLAGDELACALHDPDECYDCLISRPAIETTCRCGECCRRLIIEVLLDDAEREPRIKERGSPIKGFTNEVEGYLLNKGGPCVFLDEVTNLCSIYETRPLVCRLFNCDGEDRQELVELGILPPRTGS